MPVMSAVISSTPSSDVAAGEGVTGSGDDEELSNDPKDEKKQRRLIRNRMSAQLHRERKKAYIDKLEAEIKQRDSVIDGLNGRLNGAQQENLRLRQLLAAHGIAVEATPAPGAACSLPVVEDSSDCATQDESGADSDGTDGSCTPPPRKRAATSVQKSVQRMVPGTLLAALSFLAMFRGPSFSEHVIPRIPVEQPSQGLTSLEPHGGGRVLMSFSEDNRAEPEPSVSADSSLASSLSLITSPPSYAATYEHSYEKVKLKQPDAPLLNASYLFCPSTINTLDDALSWSARFSMGNATDPLAKQRRRKQEQQRRQESGLGAAPLLRGSDQSKNVRALPSAVQMNVATSTVLAKLLLAHSTSPAAQSPVHNDSLPGSSVVPSAENSLVVHDSSQSKVAKGMPQGAYHDDGFSDDSPHLMLLVPSTSLSGFSSVAPNHWIEIGCRMQSARFVDFQ